MIDWIVSNYFMKEVFQKNFFLNIKLTKKKKGFSLKAPDNKGATPIHISAYNSNLDCVKYLFSIFGSSCLIDKDHQNKTCLDNAINAKNILITNFLQGIFFYFLFFSYFLIF